MLNQLTSKALLNMRFFTITLFIVGMTHTPLAKADDVSNEFSPTTEAQRLELLKEFDEEFKNLYFENFATDPDDIPISEYEDGVDHYLGDLILQGNQLLLDVSGGKLIIVTKNERQEQLRQQLIKFVSEHNDVPVRVGILGFINNTRIHEAEEVDELVLVNYNNLGANATHNFFRIIEALNNMK